MELSRFVIWEVADIDNCYPEANDSLAECLQSAGYTSAAEINGLIPVELGEGAQQLEQILLDLDLGRQISVSWGSKQPITMSRLAGHSVSILDLSVRATNCLETAGIRTIGELTEWSFGRLLRLKNMGKKSAEEIISKLKGLQGDSNTGRDYIEDQSSSLPLALFLTFAQCHMDQEIQDRLLEAGISRMDDLVTRSAASLQYWAGLCASEIAGLQQELQELGLGLDSTLPLWLRAHHGKVQAIFCGEIDELVSGLDVQPPPGLPRGTTAPTCLEDELETFFKPGIKETKKQIVRRFLGWDGGEGTTLERSGQEFDLTRERIRQIVATSLRPLVSLQLHFFESAINLITQKVPTYTDDAEEALVNAGISRSYLKIRGLDKTAEYLGLSLPWITILELNAKRVVVNPSALAEIRSFCSTARKRVSHCGTTRKSYVLSNCDIEITQENIDTYCSFLEGLIWLDAQHDWFWLPTKRNTILNRLAKILSITQRLALKAAHSAVLRDRRMADIELPLSVFENLCKAQTWCSVEGSSLVGGLTVPTLDRADGEEDSDETVVVEILRRGGPFMRRRDIWISATATGVQKVSFDRVLGDSCLIVKPAPEIYGLIGCDEASVFEYFPDAEREPVAASLIKLLDCPYPSNAPEFGVFGGCDPESTAFHEAALERIFAHSGSLRSAGGWSLMELGLAEADFKTLRRWGEVNQVSFRELAARELQIGPLTITAIEALALTFLACSCVIGRNLSTEGELWPVIATDLGPSLRRQVFVNSYPKPAIRDATESICSRLNIRHVFGREGEQSWLRTVFLQFGLTKSAYRRLPGWLGRGETSLPVAIEMLLSAPGLQSASFIAFWKALQLFRWQEMSADQVRKELTKSFWVTHEEIEEILSSVVHLESSPQESIVPKNVEGNELFGAPLLKWADEPKFDLPFNTECPWLTENRYTLVFGNGRRISLTRENSGYSAGVPMGRIEVDLSETVLTVDLQRYQTSCLPAPLSIILAHADHDFIFYGPNGHLLADSDQDVEPNRAHVLLCRSDCHVTVEPEQHLHRRVFGGDWVVRSYPRGLPSDLEIRKADKILWIAPQRTKIQHIPKWKPKAVCKGGKWGELVSFVLEYLDDGRPTHLLVGGSRIELASGSADSFWGAMLLSPNTDYGRTAVRLEYEHNGRLRRVPATLQMGSVNGIAVETEQGWKVFKEGADMDSVYLQSHRILAQVPSHYDGDLCGSEEWAWMEGDHFCGRPGKSARAIGYYLHALGESLRLSVGPYNRSSGGQILARSVIHSGVIEWVEEDGGDYQIQLRHRVELGTEHALWVWREGNLEPELLPPSAWIQDADLCFVSLAGPKPIAFAISYQGAWLGSRTCSKGWHGFAELIAQTSRWHETARWLKWWRIPLLHVDLKHFVRTRVVEARTDTLKAWTSKYSLTGGACYSEDRVDAWRSVTRYFLWDWRPDSSESAAILKSLDMLTGNLAQDIDRGWDGFDELLAIVPLLLIQVASIGLPEIYSGQEREEDVQYLLEKLQNRILGVNSYASGSQVDQELTRAKAAAASALQVDELFISRGLRGEAERQLMGTPEKDRNLRVAIANSQAVRKYIAAALLDNLIRNRAE